MCQATDVDDYIRDIPFVVASFVEKCTPPGSYERAIGRAIADSVRKNVEQALRLFKEKKG
jgi:hypothetical protein